MVAGAPRTVSLSQQEMIALGKEMVSFAQKNKNKILHLSEWYTIEKMFTYKEWKTFIQREEFIPYYEQALKIVGLKYVDKNSNVRDGISQRWQRVYFCDLKEQEDLDLRAKFELEKEMELFKHNLSSDGAKVDDKVLEQFETLMSLMKNNQLQRSTSINKYSDDKKS